MACACGASDPLVNGHHGWLVRWIDDRQPARRQSAFFPHEADARELVRTVRARVQNRSPRPVEVLVIDSADQTTRD